MLVLAAFLAALFVALHGTAAAATNNTLNFQARLQTASGGIVPDGYYNIQFKLYDAASLGTNLWTETWYDSNGLTAGNDNRVRVKNGYLTVNLGSQTAFPAINWDQELWITLNIGGITQTATPTWDGEMNPRLKLTGVPYAFRAAELAKYNSATGFWSVLQLQNATGGNQTFRIPDQGAAGTYDLLTTTAANAGYIQNTTSPQNANMYVQAAASGSVAGVFRANASGSGDILQLKDGAGNNVATFGSTGSVTLKTTTDSATAFRVQNNAGQSLLNVDTAGSNLQLLGNNAATLSTWTTTTAMSVGTSTERVRGGAVAANGYLYHIGGVDAADNTVDTVQYAKLNADGTVGSWASTTSLPATRRQFQPVVVNGYLYVIGGRDGSSSTMSTSYYAKLNADGTVGAWNTTTALTNGAIALFAQGTLAYGGYIYMIGGFNSSATAQDDVYSIKANPDGTLGGSWTATSVLPNSLAAISGSVAAANGYVYIVGGYAGGGPSELYRAKINGNGTTGSWTAQTSVIPGGGVENAQAFVYNGYLYIVGGDSGNAVSALPLNGDGTVGTAISLTNYPLAPSGEAAGASANGYLYMLGGSSGTDGGGTTRNTVYYASTSRVSIGGHLDLVNYSGENLAEGNSGGNLTAGNTTIVGTLQVQDSASFVGGVSVGGSLSVSGPAVFKPSTDSTSAFQVQPAASSTPVLNVDTANSRIGIGTSSPTEALDVRNGAIRVGYTTDTFDQLVEFWRNNLKIGAIDNNAGDVRLRALNNNKLQLTNDTGDGITIDDAGNTGVGTASPGYKLDVAGDLNIGSGSVYRANGTAGVARTCTGGQLLQNATTVGGIVTGGTCAADAGVTTVGTINSQTKSANGAVIVGTSIYMQTADATNPGLVSTGSQTLAGSKTFTGNNTLFKPGTNSATAFQIQPASSTTPVFNVDTQNGRIGIGTAAPGDLVSVVGSTNGIQRLSVYNTSTGSGAQAQLQAMNDSLHEASMSIASSTFGGYGALVADSSVFYGNGVGGLTLMADATGGVIKFATNGNAEKARFDANGNLGVNTVSPSEKIEAVGNIRATQGTATTQGFEGATFVPTSPGTWSTGGAASWGRQTTNCLTPQEGTACARSGAPGDTTDELNPLQSWLDVDYTFTTAGSIRFYWKVSSERTYDFLMFCVDNDTCKVSNDLSSLRISGDTLWTEVVWPVSAGAHSFRWVYEKDGSGLSGTDRGWVDNVRIVDGGQGSIVADGQVTTSVLQAGRATVQDTLSVGTINTPGDSGYGTLNIYGNGTNGSNGSIFFGDGRNVSIKEDGSGDSDALELHAKNGMFFDTDGEEMALDSNGNLDIEGELELNIDGAKGSTVAICKTVGDSSGMETDVELGDCNGSASDIAEFYPTQPGVESGDIVAITDEMFTYDERMIDLMTGLYNGEYKQTTVPVLKKGARGDGTKLLGIISTNPYQSLGRDIVEMGASNPLPMALNGRVPVKVNDENGAIQAGDGLTASSTPGVAMKAGAGDMVIATALEGFGGTDGKIMAFVRSGTIDMSTNFADQVSDLQGQIASMGSSFNTGSLSTDSLTVTGNAIIQGDLTVGGTAKLKTLELSGHFVTTGDTPTVTLEPAAGTGLQTQVSVSGTDTAGVVTLTIGDDPGAGKLLKLTFDEPYTAEPRIVLTPVGKDSAAVQSYVDDPAADSFFLGAGIVPEAGKTYRFNYFVLQ